MLLGANLGFTFQFKTWALQKDLWTLPSSEAARVSADWPTHSATVPGTSKVKCLPNTPLPRTDLGKAQFLPVHEQRWTALKEDSQDGSGPPSPAVFTPHPGSSL